MSRQYIGLPSSEEMSFGAAGAVFNGGTFDDIFIDGFFQETPWFSGFSGEVGFEAGPMSLLTINDSEPDRVASHYEFGAGTLRLTANWMDQFGNAVEGHYVAPLVALVVDIRCEQELSASNCGGISGDSLGDAFASFGPGLFDDALAGALGIARSGGAFSFNLALECVTGSPLTRTGWRGRNVARKTWTSRSQFRNRRLFRCFFCRPSSCGGSSVEECPARHDLTRWRSVSGAVPYCSRRLIASTSILARRRCSGMSQPQRMHRQTPASRDWPSGAVARRVSAPHARQRGPVFGLRRW